MSEFSQSSGRYTCSEEEYQPDKNDETSVGANIQESQLPEWQMYELGNVTWNSLVFSVLSEKIPETYKNVEVLIQDPINGGDILPILFEMKGVLICWNVCN